MDIVIRKVRPGDEEALAYIQTESWKAAFAEIIPAELLEKYTELSRARNMYARLLTEGKGNGYILEADGRAHCIAYWDSTRDSDMPGYAELICIHSLKDNWNRGCGSRMMERVLDDMRAAGFEKAMLWVFEKNTRAIGFYRKHLFAPNGKAKDAFGSPEVMYERTL